MRIFGFDFEICTISFKLCLNIKFWRNKFFDCAITGGGSIFPRSLKTTGNKNNFEVGQKVFFSFYGLTQKGRAAAPC
jgi:hypothetical protein